MRDTTKEEKDKQIREWNTQFRVPPVCTAQRTDKDWKVWEDSKKIDGSHFNSNQPMKRTKVSFYNPGQIDPLAFQVMGVSVKTGENAIGQFGTGLKYAIAGYLRTDHTVKIKSGDKTYAFDIAKKEMRGKPFDIITCNGQELAFTLDYGKHWEDWQLYRELYSNALDEGGGAIAGNTHEDTVIEVEGPEIGAIHSERNKYFIDSTRSPIETTDEVEIYKGNSSKVFLKGVAVGSHGAGDFTYNILDGVDLTEDRTIKHGFQVNEILASAICQTENLDILKSVIGKQNGMESQFNFTYVSNECSEVFLDYLHGIFMKSPGTQLQAGLKALYVSKRGEFTRKKLTPTKRQKNMIDKAVAFLKKIDYEVTQPIYVVESEGDSLFGQAKDGEIWLTHKAFEHGCQDLAQTILEEYAHNHTGHSDCTRDFQEWLFRQVMYQGGERTGEVL